MHVYVCMYPLQSTNALYIVFLQDLIPCMEKVERLQESLIFLALPHSITQKYYCLNLKDSLTTYTLRNNECDSYNKLFFVIIFKSTIYIIYYPSIISTQINYYRNLFSKK